LLLDKLAQLLNLLAVELDAHFVSSCDQIGVDLHVHVGLVVLLILILVVIVIDIDIITVALPRIFHLLVNLATLLLLLLSVVFLVIDAAVSLLAVLLASPDQSLPL